MTDTHIIIAGQSNALGYLNTAPAPYAPTPRVQIWCDTDEDGIPDAWNYMLPGHNTGTHANKTCWGPEVAFANRWLVANPTGYLWIVKDGCVKGSTGLAKNDTMGVLDWSPESTSPPELFATATATITAAQANLNGGQFAFNTWDAVLWMQGETDAAVLVTANAYLTNLQDFITHVRNSWSVSRIVVGRISDSAALTYNAIVRVAQWQVFMDDTNVPSFKTIGFPRRQDDDIHYTAEGHVMLGQAFYYAFLGA